MSTVPASAAVGPPPGMRVRLSSNESAFGPSPAAVEAVQDVATRAHLYPDDQASDLRHALAEHEGRDVNEIAVGTGSAALLMDLLAHECVDGGSVLAYECSFIVYRLGARNARATYVEAPTSGPPTAPGPGYEREVGALLDRLDDTTRVICIDNPGNPTGAHLTGEQLRDLVSEVPEDVTIVVDEAYHQFAEGERGYQTVAELGLDHPRLLVTRTFSKAYGLAGLRVGYLQGPHELIRSLDQWRTRFNVTATGQAAAIAALGDSDHLRRTITRVREGRRRMAVGLSELGIPFTDGLGNFLTIELDGPAGEYVEAYAGRGIGVRPLAPYAMDRQIRVTVGTRDAIEAFLEASGDVLGR